MCECCNSYPPETRRQAGLIEHGGYPLTDSPISTLSNTILVGLSPDSVLAMYACFGAELLHFMRHVFPSLIISESLDASVQLVLSIGLELLECSKGLAFVLKGYVPEMVSVRTVLAISYIPMSQQW